MSIRVVAVGTSVPQQLRDACAFESATLTTVAATAQIESTPAEPPSLLVLLPTSTSEAHRALDYVWSLVNLASVPVLIWLNGSDIDLPAHNVLTGPYDIVYDTASTKEVAARIRRLAAPVLKLDDSSEVAQLRWRLSLLENLIDYLPDPVAITDRDGVHLLANHALRQMVGASDELPMQQLNPRELTPPDTLQHLSDEVFPAMRRDGKWEGVSAIQSLTGERIPVWQQWFAITDTDGSQAFTVTHIRDLRDWHRLQRQVDLTVSEQALQSRRFDAIMEATPDLVAIFSGEGRQIYLNPSGHQLIGCSDPSHSCTRSMADLHSAEVAHFLADHAIPEAIEFGTWSGETTIIPLDGSEPIPVWYTIIAVDNLDEPPILAVVARDLRELRTLQAQVDAAQVARARAEAAELAKTRFLANMSHEIRTPLNAVLGYAQLLEMEQLDSRQTETVRSIRRAGTHLLALINDVLDLSRIEAGGGALNPQPTDLNQILAELEGMFRRVCDEKGLEWTMSVDLPRPDPVMVDRQRLLQIVSNLLDNATKFTERGQIGLSVHRRSDGETEFEVTDTGRGMTVSELTNVYTPFTQGASGSIYGGTGLGLAITRNIVDMMKGSIRMALRPGGGVRAVVTIPLLATTQPTEERLASFDTFAREAFGDLHALVVDDNTDNRNVLAALLERHGLSVSQAEDGIDALEQLATTEPDIVFMDIRMPGMDGHATLREAKRRWPDRTTVYVAVTATGIATTRATYLQRGFHDLVKKPFHFNEIGMLLNNLVGAGGEAIDLAAPSPLRASHADQAHTEIDLTVDSGDTSLPERVQEQLRAAASLGRIVRLKRIVDQQLQPEAIASHPEPDRYAAELAYISQLADNYDLEELVEFLGGTD